MRLLMRSAVLFLLFPLLAVAQTEAPGSRERAQLRRVQAALQAAQNQLDGLQAEKAAWLSEKAIADKSLQRQQVAARSASQGAQAEVQEMRQQLAAEQTRQKESEAQASEREIQAQQQLAQARRELAELRQTNSTLSALLERRTEALASAEQKNRELHSLGLQAVARWLGKTELEARQQAERTLGFTQVRMQDEAEDLKARMDGLRVSPAVLQ